MDSIQPGLLSQMRAPRSRREWTVDWACFGLAMTFGILVFVDVQTAELSPLANTVVIVSGIAACFALFAMRRWPFGTALFTVCITAFSPLAAGAALIAIFGVAVHRNWKLPAAAAALVLLNLPINASIYPSVNPLWLDLLLCALVLAAVVAWGMYVRARRELLESLRERARDAEADRDLRLAQARELERTRIAREMHDVLAHRISLVALNAGALEFRPDASPEEVREAAAVVRSNAHQALEELRDVISVLREDDEDGLGSNEKPQPTMSDIDALIEESRQSGTEVRLTESIDDLSSVPDSVGRTAYRVVQEGLTNARKHAPGGTASVTLSGSAADGLTVGVSNRRPLIEIGSNPPIPGSGTGLIGLAERVELAGGRLQHGPRPDGCFTLEAWLPWST